MNIEKMNKLADFLDTLPDERFYMDRWIKVNDGCEEIEITLQNIEECGTTCCIAGWQNILENGKYVGNAEMSARNYLDLGYYQSDKLFFYRWHEIPNVPENIREISKDIRERGNYSKESIKRLTPKMAAIVIRTMVHNHIAARMRH